MNEFKFDAADVDANAIRIMEAVMPVLADENPGHVTATLLLLLASYLTVMSTEAGVSNREVDEMVDSLAGKIRHAMRLQRAHHARFSHPGHA